MKLRCEYIFCKREAVAHHPHSATNLCEQHFADREEAFGVKMKRESVKRTYKSKEFKDER